MTQQEHRLLEYLSSFVSERRKRLIDQVLGKRTRFITVVLEDIYQSQNASAVVRTCECLGLHDLYLIEQEAKYEINPRVLRGANKWMNLHRFNESEGDNTARCIEHLRTAGYRILVADPAPGGTPVTEIDISRGRIALIFGNELRGLSPTARALADERILIPMYGFTESLNISVSAGICLHHLVTRLHSSGNDIFLQESEKMEIKLAWLRKIVRGAELLEREFLRTIE